MKHDKDRYEARCLLAEEYFISLKRMKPYKDREICQKFNDSIPVSNKEWQNGGLDFYFDVVDPMVRSEDATEYPDMFGNVWTKRNKPLENVSPEKAHLSRPTEMKSGVTQYFSRNDSLEERLKTVREQIENCKHL